jgi:hypothetical protein
VHPHQALERWAAEACPDRDVLARLEHNPFFAALGDRLAIASTPALDRARRPALVELGTALVLNLEAEVALFTELRGAKAKWPGA